MSYKGSISRRNVIKSVSGSIVGLELGTNSGLASTVERYRRIVTARGGFNNEARETLKVPKRWDENWTEIEKVRDSLSNQLSHMDFVTDIYIGGSDVMSGGVYFPELVIEVEPDASSSNMNQLPKSIEELDVKNGNGIVRSDIRIEESDTNNKNLDSGIEPEGPIDGSTPFGCEVGGDPYPGGVRLELDNGWNGTGGFLIYDGDYNECLYTCNHIFSPPDSCTIEKNVLAEDYNSSEIGYVERAGTV